ncbi:hypothetical protein Lfu02_58530 [Longispora fulva]|uniref:Uncharacterized protein n=1 Tax=Longispora fulva TaxID=619741 RepID=A0A8J7GIG0_9ACTN|nr:hypothetical protein [Longispora fulva]MBG6137165.1 hypothetical protein [Longispora fulva]GIG61481.1 hypothetical protein Lfu02_58530 [Longispora fulva]
MREVPVGGGTRPGTQIPLRFVEVEPRLPNYEVTPGGGRVLTN